VVVRVACCIALAAVAATSASASTTRAACPSPARATTLPRWPTGGSLRGATIHYARAAPVTCAFFLTIGRYAYPVEREFADKELLAKDWVGREPRVEAILDLGSAQDVVVVALGEGASNLDVTLYTVSSRHIVPLPVGRGDLLLYGSIGPGSLYVTCDHHGGLATHLLHPANLNARIWRRFVIDTTQYRLHGTRFVRVSRHSSSGPMRIMDARFDRFTRRGQFGGCRVAGKPNFF
jgi:hypothetical protein